MFFEYRIALGQLWQIRTVANNGMWREAGDFAGYFLTINDNTNFDDDPRAHLRRRESVATLARWVPFEGNEASSEPTCDGADLCEEGQVPICHIPPGNPDNRHAICVGEPAVDTHIERHGDFTLDADNRLDCE